MTIPNFVVDNMEQFEYTIYTEVEILLVRRHVKAVLGAGEGKRPVTFVARQGSEPGPLDIRVVRVGD